MNLWTRLSAPRTAERAGLLELFPTWENQASESAPGNFMGVVDQIYRQSPIVYAAVQARMMLFSDVRFAFRRRRDKEIITEHPNLEILEHPWPGGTTSELLARMEQDGSLAGNCYIYKASSDHLQRLRPDLVDVMTNRREVVGYHYHPDGRGSGPTEYILSRDMAHYTPMPDPARNFVGMSWVQAAVMDSIADKRMAQHQAKFYENAATPNLFVKVEQTLTDDSRNRLRSELERRYGGWQNSYKTLVLDGGADIRAVGADFIQADFANNRAANELRIAVASGVPPVILGIKDGLESATYSNYDQAFKQFAVLLRSLWKQSTTALSSIVTVPRGSDLYPDPSEVMALQDSAVNVANLRQVHAATINTLISAGFTAESANKAVISGDFNQLDHTGLFSVQLQKPGMTETPSAPVPLPEDVPNE